jgi:S-adenosylmethionine:tRNA ribosyltransferase-isomerase
LNKTPVSDLDYELPVGSIAQEPYRNPEDSKILDASTKEIYKFLDIDKLIDSKSLLLFNSSQVIDVRIKTRKIKTGGQFEIFILEILGKNTAICLIKTRGKKILNEEILLENFNLTLVSQEKDKFEVIFSMSVLDIIQNFGITPLPPYIADEEHKYKYYKNFFSNKGFSTASSTAGLHFTPNIFKKLTNKGIEIDYINLDIGLGTFKPISTDYVEDFNIHSENYEIDKNIFENIVKKKEIGYKIYCVGTTTLRALEYAFINSKLKGSNDLFITKGFKFNIADFLITNFHAPKSTLISIVQAIYGNKWKELYKFALDKNLKFLSFGDAVLFKIINK